MKYLVLLCTFLFVSVGCEQSIVHDQTLGNTSQSTDTTSGMIVSMSIDRRSAGIADRVHLSITVARPESITFSFEIENALIDAGWTIVSESKAPTTRSNQLYTSRWEYVLEPFLDGIYQVPDLNVHINAIEDDKSIRNLICDGFQIEIHSSLTDDQDLELSTLSSLHSPGSNHSDESIMNPWVTISFVFIGVGSLVLMIAQPWKRKVDSDPKHDAVQELKALAKGVHKNTDEAFAMLHKILLDLDHSLQQTSEISLLIQECEQNRYNRAGSILTDDSPEHIAQHTLELIELANKECV